ncbi:myc-associated zinc finger protein isoform X2 [Scophthalmus maximus]|uniref:myc-associated zinc finger protein isoform X2 n=1 Tax=Scophthalmus maximus TaxID=52904 RepID=UPI0015E103CB|nr:myc-associated zinc finger protein isoform X2 [Scophthalmus maximus]
MLLSEPASILTRDRAPRVRSPQATRRPQAPTELLLTAERSGANDRAPSSQADGGSSCSAAVRASCSRAPSPFSRPPPLRAPGRSSSMDTSWSNFLFQTPAAPTRSDTPLQSELLPELSDSSQTPSTDHVVPPPSTVDTAALSEEPLPVKPVVKAARPPHVCVTCNKEFKNSYNLRRHQSVHTGIRMKDRAAREREDGGRGGGRGEKQAVPLSLLQLTLPPQAPPPPAVAPDTIPQPGLHANQESRPISVSIAPATVTMAAPQQPIQAAVVIVGSMEQSRSPGAHSSSSSSSSQVRKNHACEACGKAFRDVYHLNRHRLSHSDEKPYSCPVCQQRFKRKDRMSYHVRSHQGGVEKPYVCPHCAKAFSRPDHLNSHVRQVHSTERPFKCTTCTSAFATRDRLRAHLIRHEEKVPCHICGKLLSAAYITDHMRVHNQSQHHACHLCNRSFTTLTYLRVHAQKHHGQEWKESGGARGGFGGTGAGGVLLCQLCGVQCKTATQLQGHMGTHANQGNGGGADPTSSGTVGSTSVAVTVSSAASAVGLLVTDCSSIVPQTHS